MKIKIKMRIEVVMALIDEGTTNIRPEKADPLLALAHPKLRINYFVPIFVVLRQCLIIIKN
jgi:hypothetical protein